MYQKVCLDFVKLLLIEFNVLIINSLCKNLLMFFYNNLIGYFKLIDLKKSSIENQINRKPFFLFHFYKLIRSIMNGFE